MASPLFSLQGQTAVVTGGTRGIGQAMALGLAEAGADIILVQRDITETTTKCAIEALGRNAFVYKADLALPEQVAGLTSTILADGHEVRILLTCAGIQRRHKCEEFPDHDFDEVRLPSASALLCSSMSCGRIARRERRPMASQPSCTPLVAPSSKADKSSDGQVMQVNLHAVFTLTRDLGAHMLSLAPSPTTGRCGSVIHVASLLTFQGGLTVPAYAASKGAVGQLTKAFSNEWASRGVTVNAVAPGYVDTDMNTALLADAAREASIRARIPAGRWGVPDDFKGTVVYLASRASGYVSGHTLVVDGGWMGR
ncbi:2-deoxy-D-gluconate 3-dehydrogenase [Drechmeria coniospora]|uniref:2-deoxy-D-gluconate 3-dehydrogenase n=1 Tax=Drechmeria coniospora TaxID=98403 RepID=A0A151GIY8_DRECN|nr:2-deoxy-D-gluconate 3-dehydrogenase [Drechmeria coniospora]KYK56992.1 2-deoxy-D-gluconate 3-dehydrogenase [Drechmeria coniospora]